MKKSFLLFVFSFICLTSFAQWQNGTNNLLYTTTGNVTIGASTVQGNYGSSDRSLEIVSQSGSYLNLKSGTKSLFLGCSTYGNAIYIPSNEAFGFAYGAQQVMKINPNLTVSIGTSLTPTGYKLAVGGKIIAEELKIQLQSAPWPDYVFTSDYKLPTLEEVEKQIKEKGHLLNVPTACEIEENGFEVGNMTIIQQEKIEELTLYIIEQNKINEKQSKEIEELKIAIQSLLNREK
jgi:hypothetical protein